MSFTYAWWKNCDSFKTLSNGDKPIALTDIQYKYSSHKSRLRGLNGNCGVTACPSIQLVGRKKGGAGMNMN